MKYLYALMALTLLLSACMPSVPGPAKALMESAGNVPTEEEIKKECTEAIDFKVLIETLPKEINGFEAGEPQGQTMTMADPESGNQIKYSTASVELTKDDQRIDVTVMDTCYLQYLSYAWMGYFEMESTDGYLKKVTVNGQNGWHQYDKSSETYSYNVFVDNRVIVTVQGSSNVPDSDVKAALDGIDMGKIASSAK